MWFEPIGALHDICIPGVCNSHALPMKKVSKSEIHIKKSIFLVAFTFFQRRYAVIAHFKIVYSIAQ